MIYLDEWKLPKFHASDDQRIVQMQISRDKEFSGNSVVAVRNFYRDRSGKWRWKINKIALSSNKNRPIHKFGRAWPNPFLSPVRSIWDYERLPNFYNPNFLEKLQEEWESVKDDYIETLERKHLKIPAKKLAFIKANVRVLTVTTFVSASEVLQLLSKITWIGPDNLERRMYNPEEVAALIDRCDRICMFGEDPLHPQRIEFQAEWFRTTGEEFNSRPYPEDVTWKDIEAAIKNGF